jgi:hypothetical protein
VLFLSANTFAFEMFLQYLQCSNMNACLFIKWPMSDSQIEFLFRPQYSSLLLMIEPFKAKWLLYLPPI